MRFGGIVLCGGRSIRMGMSKATLPFGPELMLERVVRLLSEAVCPVVVVAAAEQIVPPLGPAVRVVRDRRQDRGPLEGMLVGLTASAPEVDAAYITSCDVPLLVPAFVRRMTELLADHDVAVPYCGGFHHPLAAVYRRRVACEIEAQLTADRLRPTLLFKTVPTRIVDAEGLIDADPELTTLMNLNCPADYLTALARAGFTAPQEVVGRLER